MKIIQTWEIEAVLISNSRVWNVKTEVSSLIERQTLTSPSKEKALKSGVKWRSYEIGAAQVGSSCLCVSAMKSN